MINNNTNSSKTPSNLFESQVNDAKSGWHITVIKTKKDGKK